MGSGSLAAMAVFEAGYKPDMEREEAITLVHDAIAAGIFNDLGSGSNIDITVLTKGKTDILRNYAKPNERAFRSLVLPYSFPPGTTRTFCFENQIAFSAILLTQLF
jgi:20S proteasome subunit beta 2